LNYGFTLPRGVHPAPISAAVKESTAGATILLQKRVLKEALGLAIARLTHFSYHQIVRIYSYYRIE
jgi:hypothetical protein